ncbi:unnamed protein product [Paramecium octaurelia]|uniref:Uncharacterized protein n=1 Tax=Paramecium octaurelia TaxID=43137 RepID=A0A8S1SXJ8_PAROT|nr:unnamed protein product [Paramecium octaurelia]
MLHTHQMLHISLRFEQDEYLPQGSICMSQRSLWFYFFERMQTEGLQIAYINYS